ncbi:hypothetical protein M758_2G217100 [Ceratodon purpureus]|nr:hypothetical protein M758_2G217100 [Ceratodon purpureus]
MPSLNLNLYPLPTPPRCCIPNLPNAGASLTSKYTIISNLIAVSPLRFVPTQPHPLTTTLQIINPRPQTPQTQHHNVTTPPPSTIHRHLLLILHPQSNHLLKT